jgi:hypothetical protein
MVCVSLVLGQATALTSLCSTTNNKISTYIRPTARPVTLDTILITPKPPVKSAPQPDVNTAQLTVRTAHKLSAHCSQTSTTNIISDVSMEYENWNDDVDESEGDRTGQASGDYQNQNDSALTVS